MQNPLGKFKHRNIAFGVRQRTEFSTGLQIIENMLQPIPPVQKIPMVSL